MDVFKLSGTVELNTDRAEAGLKRLDARAKGSATEIGRLADSGRRLGGLGGHLDTAAGAAGRFGSAVSGLVGKMGSLRGVTGQVGSAFAGLGTELLTAGIGKLSDAFSLAIKTGLDFNKMMEGAGIVFENLAGSAAGAQKHLNDLKEFAKTSPFDLPDLIQASARMQAFGVKIEQVVPQLRNIQNAAALAAGTSGNFTEALGGINTALGQMRAKGKVSAEEMNQLAERGVPAWELLAKKIGLTVQETMKLGETGKLKGAPAAEALIESFGEGKFAGLAEKLSKTTLGKESNLRDALSQQAGEAAKDTVAAYNNALDEALKQANTPRAAEIGKKANAPVAAGLQLGTDIMSGATTAKEIGAALIPTAKDTVKDLTKILSEGISSAWSITKEIASGVAESAGISMGQGAIKGTKGALQSQSPSKVYIGIGEDAAEGFVIGFENGKKRILTANEKLVEELKKQFDRANKEFAGMFDEAAKKTGLPAELLMGIASRETNMRNIVGDKGRGVGVMQVDVGTDAAFKASGAWKDAAAAIERGAEILKDKITQLVTLAGEQVTIKSRAGDKFSFTVPELSGADLTRTGIASYNSGLFAARNVSLGRSVDASTTGRDYSADVLQRAEIFRQLRAGSIGRGTDGAAALPFLPSSGLARLAIGTPGVTGAAPAPILLEKTADSLKALPPALGGVNAALATTTPAIGKTATATRDWRSEIVDLGAAAEKAKDHFAEFKDSLANGFDNLLEGRGGLKQFGSSLLRSFGGGLISLATGGKASSPGQLLAGLLTGGLRGGGAGAGGGGGTGAGSFLTGGFAGGNPAAAALGGGSGSGGALGAISGGLNAAQDVAGALGKGGVLSKLPGLGKVGGFLTKLPGVGGLFSKLGGLFGLGGDGAAAGAAGGGAAGAGGLALLSNPFTAIIGGALFALPLIGKLFGDKTLKSLKGLVRGEYGIDVKSDSVLGNIKSIGESRYGADFKNRQIETVRLPEVKELLFEYAARTNQKGNSKLNSPAALQDQFSAMNQFSVRAPGRAMGGPVIAGHPYIVGERRPELFVPSTSGQIYPSVPQGGRGIVPTAGLPPGGSQALLDVLDQIGVALDRLQGIPPGHIVAQGLAERPGLAAQDVRRAFDQQTEDSRLLRDRIARR